MQNMLQTSMQMTMQTNNANDQVREFVTALMGQFGEMVMPTQQTEENELTHALNVIAKEVIKKSEPEVAQFAECEPIVEMMGQSLAMLISTLKVKPIKAPNGMIVGLGGITEK